MKYAICMGGLFKFTDSEYKRFLKEAATGGAWDLEAFGEMVDVNVPNVTDLSEEGAKELLKKLVSKPKKPRQRKVRKEKVQTTDVRGFSDALRTFASYERRRGR